MSADRPFHPSRAPIGPLPRVPTRALVAVAIWALVMAGIYAVLGWALVTGLHHGGL